MLSGHDTIGAACFFSFVGILVSLYQILCHLRNYTEPVFQRYIIRIIFMVPVYAVGSLCSLVWRDRAIYFDTMRDCYESWIIYNFSSLLLAYVGGPGAVVVKAEGKLVHPSWAHMTCCLPTMQVDGFFLRRCKQGTLQFVLLKPLMAILTVILYAAGAYTDGDMSPANGYFYISILYNVCYTFALYGLLLFWIGATELLQPFNPLLKFVVVKTVVFLTFWQGIAISYINSVGELTDPEEGKALQNIMICVEMAIVGFALLFAFPHKEYQIGGSTAGFRLQAFIHAISIRDVVADTIHVFAPSYSDYVLYTDGGPADNVKRKKFRGQKGGASEHPKAGLIKNMEKGMMADDDDETLGRRSKTPVESKKMEAHRKQAILLDSDSDGMDSDDEGPQLGTEIAGDSDEDDGDVYQRYTRAAAAPTRNSMSDGEEQGAVGSRRVSRQYHSRNSRSRGTRRSVSVIGEGQGGMEKAGKDEAVVGNPSSEKHRGQTRTGSYSLPAPPAPSIKPLAAGAMVAPVPLRMLFRGPILSDSDDDSDESNDSEQQLSLKAGAATARGMEPELSKKEEQQEAAGSATPDYSSKSKAELLQEQTAAAVRSSAAAVMRQVSAKAFAAAGRVLEAAHLPVPGSPGRSGYSAVLPPLAPPQRAAGSAAAATAGSNSGDSSMPGAAAADWEPAFPGQQRADGNEQQQQQPVFSGQQGHPQDGGGSEWAEQGWSSVKL